MQARAAVQLLSFFTSLKVTLIVNKLCGAVKRRERGLKVCCISHASVIHAVHFLSYVMFG